jgi:hypothetical protein
MLRSAYQIRPCAHVSIPYSSYWRVWQQLMWACPWSLETLCVGIGMGIIGLVPICGAPDICLSQRYRTQSANAALFLD